MFSSLFDEVVGNVFQNLEKTINIYTNIGFLGLVNICIDMKKFSDRCRLEF